jgi:hypothetical protein
MSVVIPNALAQADRSHVVGALKLIAKKTPDQWLARGHPARGGQLPRTWQAVNGMSNQQVIEATAVAGPNHCIDGWSYASRAMSAVFAGDMHAARHLAYYAQLRAGMALLANLGVGVFNRVNFSISAGGAIIRVDTAPFNRPHGPGMGTHDAVWECLRVWALGVQTSRVFLDLVKIRGVSLRDCLLAIWPGYSAATAVTSLIDAWGVDLRRGKDEHVYRNISSYAPHALNQLPSQVSESLSFARNLWDLFEPSGSSSFDKLDRFLLRSMLHKQHRNLTNNRNYAAGGIGARYEQLPQSIRALTTNRFLTNQDEPGSPELLQLALATSKPAKALEMLARALLLLRAATSFTHTSLVEAGLDCAGDDLRPWIDQWASSRGLWSPAAPLDVPVALWDDVEIALRELHESQQPQPTSLNDWLSRAGKGLPTLQETERIAVWSLCA